MKIDSLNKKSLLIVFILSQMVVGANAQNANDEKYYNLSDRKWLVELPLWVPGFRGQLAYGDLDLSSSGTGNEKEFDRISNKTGIEFYFVGRLAIKYKKFWFQADAFSGEIGSAFTYTSLIGNRERELVNVKIRGTIPRFVLGYSVWQKSTKNNFKIDVIPYVGIRSVSIRLQSSIIDSAVIIDVSPNWINPVIGVYIPLLYKRFKYETQFDFGKSGNNVSWNYSNRLRYRISKLVDVQLGWNVVRLDHNSLIGKEQFTSRMRLMGPTAGVGFRF